MLGTDYIKYRSRDYSDPSAPPTVRTAIDTSHETVRKHVPHTNGMTMTTTRHTHTAHFNLSEHTLSLDINLDRS